MKTRLHSVIVLLLAGFVLFASSQSALCELACGLGTRNVGCHGTAEQSNAPDAMPGMMHGHCSGAMTDTAHKAAMVGHPAAVQLRDGDMGRCQHPSTVAIESSSSYSASFTAMQWVILEVVPFERALSHQRLDTETTTPPTLASIDPVLVALRV